MNSIVEFMLTITLPQCHCVSIPQSTTLVVPQNGWNKAGQGGLGAAAEAAYQAECAGSNRPFRSSDWHASAKAAVARRAAGLQ